MTSLMCSCRKGFQISLTVSPVSWLKLGCFLMSSASLIFRVFLFPTMSSQSSVYSIHCHGIPDVGAASPLRGQFDMYKYFYRSSYLRANNACLDLWVVV